MNQRANEAQATKPNRRILLIDDNQEIHRDYRKILAPHDASQDGALDVLEDALFGDEDPPARASAGQPVVFELDSALQGQEAYAKARAAVESGEPFALAFVDMRMPPGWDGVETIRKLWEADPELQVVVCTAYADYSWGQMVATLGSTDRLLILKKPFDAIEVLQLASAMTEKWNVAQRERERVQEVLRASQEAKAYAASLETVNRALEQAKVSADAAAKERSEFLVRMAGGILAPMSSLVDEAERVRRLTPPGEVDQTWMHLVEELCQDGRALTSSLQDVLDLTAMETGTFELERADCDPLEIAERVLEQAEELARGKPIELRLERGRNVPPSLETDRSYLERILFHLVSNAITYAESGLVTLGVEGQAGSPTRVTFVVEDSGPGFSPEMRAHLFEPFCHAYTRVHDERDGAGIGLYLSKRMARALGGDLTLAEDDGVPGRGSRLDLAIDTARQAARSRA